MTFRIGLLVAFVAAFVACAGGDEAAEEPVKSDVEAGMPDAPGDAGEASPKPAGEGQADVAEEKPPEPAVPAATPVPTPEAVPEKSQPNYEAAAAAAQKADALGKLENEEKDMFVSAWALNVRSGPGMKYEVLSFLKRGEKVRVQEKVGIWAMIGENRYVSLNYLADNEP